MNMTRRTLIASAAAVVAMSVAAHAGSFGSARPAPGTSDPAVEKRGPRPHRPDRGAFFKEMDKDGDGAVTLDEFTDFHADRARGAFSRFDRNGDGVLNAEDRPGKRSGRDGPMKRSKRDKPAH